MRKATMLLALLLVASCTGTASDVEVPAADITTTTEAMAVFVHGEDDLCEWITEEDVARFAREAHAAIGAEWDGEAALSQADWGEAECHWMLLQGYERGGVSAEFVSVRADNHDDVVDYADLLEFNSLQGEPVSGHPDLPAGVLLVGQAYGRYAFWLPGMDDAVMLTVHLDQADQDAHDTALFAVANGFLEALGWTEVTDG